MKLCFVGLQFYTQNKVPTQTYLSSFLVEHFFIEERESTASMRFITRRKIPQGLQLSTRKKDPHIYI